VAAQTSPRFLGWCSVLLMAEQEQPAGPPMTLGNMRELAVRGWHRRLAELRRERFIGASSSLDAGSVSRCGDGGGHILCFHDNDPQPTMVRSDLHPNIKIGFARVLQKPRVLQKQC
jgi:hypothetical protein